MRIVKRKMVVSTARIQVCAGISGGVEAAVHAVRQVFEDKNTEAIILVDADDAFNRLNRKATLHNIKQVCPEISTYVINTYRTLRKIIVPWEHTHNANQEISGSKLPSFEDYLMPMNEKSIFLNDCSEAELLEIISNLDNNKSSDIPIRVIKKSAHVICPALSCYFNTLMAEGTFPDVLKVGKVTPIFKKGNVEDVGNYRPVSTLPIFGKIFEKVIVNLYYFISEDLTSYLPQDV